MLGVKQIPFDLQCPGGWDESLIMERPHSNSKIDRAGKVLAGRIESDPALFNDSFLILTQWRTFHAYALNAVFMTLKNRALAIDQEATLAQRLKRFRSIQSKLVRQQNMGQNMALTQMQDIAGCRAVVGTVGDVFRLKQRYEDYAESFPDRGPRLIHGSTKNYILSPKEDGYRSIHLVLKYRTSKKEAEHCNGLRVEVQIRSRLQHAWAMAVETAGAMTDQALKSGEGKESWKEFFRLMSSAIAAKENLPIITGGSGSIDALSKTVLYKKIRRLSTLLKVIPLFEGMAYTVPAREDRLDIPGDYYILELNSEERYTHYRPFKKSEFSKAAKEYADLERTHKDNQNIQVVLVSVDSLEALKIAFPSYFFDTKQFVDLIRECCA